MENKEQRKKSLIDSIDIPYMIRCVRRMFTLIVPTAIILGALVYLWEDTHNQAEYTVSVELAVVPRDNAVGKQHDSQMKMATTRCLSVLNSNTLYDQIKIECGGRKPIGTLTSTQVPETNIIKMMSVSKDSKEALKLLRAGINAYPEVAGYMEYGYLLVSLNELSADNIEVDRDRALYAGLIAIAIVLILGFGAVLFLAFVTDKIHNENQAEELIDGSLIGSLAFVKKKRGEKALLITQDQIDISYIENVDRIATYIQRELEDTGSKTALVTSIKENEGKTTVIVNIALNLADRGYKVALIDCDMRRPAIVKIFQMADKVKVNISEVLTGKADIEDCKVMHESGIALYMQKKSIKDADKLLDKEVLTHVFDTIRDKYDFILIDTPPIGIIRDSELMASSIDRAVLVFGQDEVHAADVNDSIDLLENAGTDFIGTIMNKKRVSILEKNSDGYANYYYYYGYGYGER